MSWLSRIVESLAARATTPSTPPPTPSARDGSPDSLSGGAGTDTLDIDNVSGERDNDDEVVDGADDTIV